MDEFDPPQAGFLERTRVLANRSRVPDDGLEMDAISTRVKGHHWLPDGAGVLVRRHGASGRDAGKRARPGKRW